MSKKAIVTPEGAERYNLPKGATVEYTKMQASHVPGSSATFLKDVTFKGKKITPRMTLGSDAVLKSNMESSKI